MVDDPGRYLRGCKSPLRRYLMRKSYDMGCGVSSILEKAIPGSLDPVKAKVDSFLQP